MLVYIYSERSIFLFTNLNHDRIYFVNSNNDFNPYPAEKLLTSAINIEPGQPVHLCSLTRLCTISWPTSDLHLYTRKLIMDSQKISPLQKFSRVKVKLNHPSTWFIHSLWFVEITAQCCHHSTCTRPKFYKLYRFLYCLLPYYIFTLHYKKS